MATLAADKPRIFETGHDVYPNELPLIASDIIYQGAAVGESADTGTFRPLVSADKFAGFAIRQADNSSGAASDVNVEVYQKGCVVLSVTGVTGITDMGKDVYATDDDTFTLTIGGSLIGRIVRHISGTKCLVAFEAFYLRPVVDFTFADETVSLATDRAIFLATTGWYIEGITQIHSVAAGGTSNLQVTKDVSTDAPGAGTDLLTNNTNAGFDLNGTANTVQTGTLATTAGLRHLAAGNRLSLDFAHAIQSTAGLKIGLRLRRL
jgi:hypothetical protein